MKREINPMDYLDLDNWSKSFPKFIEAIELEESLKTNRVIFTFSRKSNSDKFIFDFSDMAKIQILALIELQSKGDQYLYETRMIKDLVGFNNHINNVIGQLKNVLKKFKEKGDHLPGYEVLKKIKVLGKPGYSVEGYDCHRIIYSPLFQYNRIRIDSVLFHYKDQPRLEFDEIIYNTIINLNPQRNSNGYQEKLNNTIKKSLSTIK